MNLPPLLLIFGEDHFRRSRFTSHFCERATDEGWVVEKGGLEDVSSISWLPGRFLVLVENPSQVPIEGLLEMHREGESDLSICLLFTKKSPILKECRQAFPKEIQKSFLLPASFQETARALEFVREEFSMRGLTAEEKMARVLILAAGTDLGFLSWEIFKLSHLSDQEVTLGDIRSSVAQIWEVSIFKLLEAVGKKNLKLFLQTERRISETYSGDPTIHFGMILVNDFLKWLKVRSLLDKGWTLDLISKELGIHPLAMKKNVYPYVKNWNAKILMQGVQCLERILRLAKSGIQNPWGLLISELSEIMGDH